MHVCHVIHSLGRGGAEHVLVNLARVPAQRRPLLSVVALVDVDGDEGHRRQLERLGVPVVTLGLGSRWDPRGFTRLERAVADLAPDVLHAHMKHADLLAGWAGRTRRTPVVSTLHVIEDGRGAVGAGKRWMARQVRLRTAASTIAVSEAQRSWYLATSGADPRTVVTVHNGVVDETAPDPEDRAALRSALGVRSDAVLAVDVAIMRPGKGHLDLLEAVADLPPDNGVVVALVGDGVLRPTLEDVVRRDVRLRDRVRFTGYRDDVPRLLAAADLLVHPTHTDALPTVVMQALAAGLPVVATDVGGIPEMVSECEGRLVAPGRPAELAAALDRLAGDQPARERMGRAARKRFEDEFDASVWASRLDAVYASVVAGG